MKFLPRKIEQGRRSDVRTGCDMPYTLDVASWGPLGPYSRVSVLVQVLRFCLDLREADDGALLIVESSFRLSPSVQLGVWRCTDVCWVDGILFAIVSTFVILCSRTGGRRARARLMELKSPGMKSVLVSFRFAPVSKREGPTSPSITGEVVSPLFFCGVSYSLLQYKAGETGLTIDMTMTSLSPNGLEPFLFGLPDRSNPFRLERKPEVSKILEPSASAG